MLSHLQAFDAGRHGGLFLGQAVVDIAAMLQEGRLHAMTPISSSTGRQSVRQSTLLLQCASLASVCSSSWLAMMQQSTFSEAYLVGLLTSI